ncbi:MAG: HAMP domain-containing methyl-accepting chemotaxis protein [Candidatus Gastranaerophilales bacterium]|nr:HAMP domain-containing methyl-accepting chemotaxis protein [Candidatus Gastranaerophilales bacterium]
MLIGFRDLKISQKILGFVIISVILTGIVGLMGLFSINSAKNKLASMYNQRLLSIKWLNENRTHIRANEASLLWIIINPDQTQQQKYIDDINNRANKFNENIVNFENLMLDLQEKEDLTNLKKFLEEYRIVRTEVIRMATQGQSKQALNYFLNNKSSFEDATKYLINIGDYNQTLAEEISKQDRINATRAITLILVTLLIAIIISLSFGLYLARMIPKRLNTITDWLREVANGNLSMEDVKIKADDELGNIGVGLNKTAHSLRSLVKQVLESANTMSQDSEELNSAAGQTSLSSQQVAKSVQQLARGSQQVSQNIENGANNINKLNKIIQNISGEANDIAKLGNKTETNANEGKEHVKKVVNKINSIKVASNEISDTISKMGRLSSEIETIVDLIKSLASQTNLLALNAAVEAARAGENGKGFAVVANEVKKLANKSAESTDKISAMIKEIQNITHLAVLSMDKGINEVEEGVVVINDAENAIENIINHVKQANSKIQDIHKEIDGVAKSSDAIVYMIDNAANVTKETAISAEEITNIIEKQTVTLEELDASSQTIAKIAGNLQRHVSIFKV